MLRKKILIFMTLGFALGTSILFVVTRVYFLKRFEVLERMDIEQVMRGVSAVYENEIDNFDTFIHDWAAWDDTYEFVKDINQEYIESNLMNETFTGVYLNLIAYFNTEGELVYGKAFDLEEEKEIEIPKELEQQLAKISRDMLADKEIGSTRGILDVGKLWIFVAQQILPSKEDGPARGILVMARHFDDRVLDKLSKSIDLPIEMYIWSKDKEDGVLQEVEENSFDEKGIFLKEISRDSVAGYFLFKDYYREPVMVLKTKVERAIFREAELSVNSYILGAVGFYLLLIIIMLFTVDRLVLIRIADLFSDVEEVRRTGDFTKRMRVKSTTEKDEVRKLAVSINELLSMIEKYRREKEEAEIKLIDKNIELEKMNKLMVGREGKIIEMKKEVERMKKDLEKRRRG